MLARSASALVCSDLRHLSQHWFLFDMVLWRPHVVAGCGHLDSVCLKAEVRPSMRMFCPSRVGSCAVCMATFIGL